MLKEAGILAAEIVGFPKFRRNRYGDIVSGSVQATGKDGLVGYLTENCCRASGSCEVACAPECAPAGRRAAATSTARNARAAQARRRAA